MRATFFKSERDIDVIRQHFESTGEMLANVDGQNIKIFRRKKELIGYVVFKIDKSEMLIDWIWAPGNGKLVFNKMLKMHPHISMVVLNVSIDPTEDKNTVMKRLNFYISMQFKVTDIKFRSRYGPLLTMKRHVQVDYT